MSKILNIYCVNVGEEYFISLQNPISNTALYTSFDMQTLFWNDNKEVAAGTFKKYWYKLSELPKKVFIELPKSKFNFRYELKSNSELNLKEDYYNSLDKVVKNHYKNSITNIQYYTLVYDELKERFKEKEFKLHMLASLDKVNLPKNNVRYVIKQEYEKRFITSFTNLIKYNVLSELQCDPISLANEPCFITSKTLYKIIRNYLKINLNYEECELKDYDFCLTVTKRVHNAKGEKKDKNNFSLLNYNHKSYIIYKIAPKAYQTYNVIKPLHGNNERDLEIKLDKYLKSIINELNKIHTQCSCCNGLGITITD